MAAKHAAIGLKANLLLTNASFGKPVFIKTYTKFLADSRNLVETQLDRFPDEVSRENRGIGTGFLNVINPVIAKLNASGLQRIVLQPREVAVIMALQEFSGGILNSFLGKNKGRYQTQMKSVMGVLDPFIKDKLAH